MPTTAPEWLAHPERRWIDCSVEGVIEPNEYAVQIPINDHSVAAAVPRDYVRVSPQLPNSGTVLVIVVAKLPDDNVLADLPTTPINGTRRVSIMSNRLR